MRETVPGTFYLAFYLAKLLFSFAFSYSLFSIVIGIGMLAIVLIFY